ncbi:MAG: hypothetical protein ABSA45_05955 [Verrucomicrobiota bacterium]|jgi:hypothetical protein
MRGWQIALGEILAPVAVLAVFQWLLLLVGAGLVFYLPVKQEALFLPIAIGAAFLLPVLDVLLLLFPAAAVPLASLAATIILAAEAGFGVMLLGKLFERFDMTEEPAS